MAYAGGLAGVPISKRIGPDEYRAAPALWSVATAPGKVYVASNDGVLVHDGVEWTTVPLPIGVNATIVRRLPDGTILVGGNDTYGRLELDPVRGYRYVDLWRAAACRRPIATSARCGKWCRRRKASTCSRRISCT